MLRYRSDIVLFETQSLRTRDKLTLPSKGYAFDDFYAVIEVKMRRLNHRSDSTYLRLINDDFNKLQRIIKEVEQGARARYYLVCFDKKNNIEEGLRRYGGNNRIDFRYVFNTPEANLPDHRA